MYVVGIDAGGTRTRSVLIDFQRIELLEHTVEGPANPTAVGWDIALANILRSVERLIEAHGINPSIIALSAAYTGWGKYVGRYRDFIRSRFPKSMVDVYTDEEAMLYSCHPMGTGISCIMGTGSHCIGSDGKRIMRVGGWGHIFDDELGGFRVGRDAIQYILKIYDHRLNIDSVLTKLFLEYMGTSNIYDAIDALYREPSSIKTRVAGFAEYVVRAARENDVLAVKILKSLANDFIEHIKAILSILEASKRIGEIEVCLGGGLYLGGRDVLEKILVDTSAKQGLRIRITTPVLRPECAVALRSYLKYSDLRPECIKDILKYVPRECLLNNG